MVLCHYAVCAKAFDEYTYGLAEGNGASGQAEITRRSWGPTRQQPNTSERAEKSRCLWPCLQGVTRTVEQSRIPVGCSLGNWAGQVIKGLVGIRGQLGRQIGF